MDQNQKNSALGPSNQAQKPVNLLKSAHCLLWGTENKLAGNIILKHSNDTLTNTASVSAHTHHPPRETKNQQTKIDKNKKKGYTEK